MREQDKCGRWIHEFAVVLRERDAPSRRKRDSEHQASPRHTCGLQELASRKPRGPRRLQASEKARSGGIHQRLHGAPPYASDLAASLIAVRMRTYVPQRQMFPAIASSMSLSLGVFFVFSSAVAASTWPDWQYPHWTTSLRTQASCTALPTRSDSIASIVVIALP